MTTTKSNTIRQYYVNGLVYPYFTFARRGDGQSWIMTGNPGMVGDSGEYDSPIDLGDFSPEEFMKLYFGDRQ